MLLELDAGETDDEPEALWQLFDLLSIACGGHAGDAASMTRVIDACARHRIAAGAHPSYPDRENFGRCSIAIDPTALEASIASQCAGLVAIASAHGIAITHVKPHGALYHDAAKDRLLAEAVVRGSMRATAVADRITLIGPPTGALVDAAAAAGLRYLREGFADRGVAADGTLIARGQPGALITDPVAAATRARALMHEVDALCVHADTPNALAVARAVREALRG